MAEGCVNRKGRQARRKNYRNNKWKRDNSLDRHKKFEDMMNYINDMNTQFWKTMDEHTFDSRYIGSSDNLLFNPPGPPAGFGCPCNHVSSFHYPSFFTSENAGIYYHMPTVPPRLTSPTAQRPWERNPLSNNFEGHNQNSSASF